MDKVFLDRKKMQTLKTRMKAFRPRVQTLKKRVKKMFHHRWLFPVVFLYFEILLRLFAGEWPLRHLVYLLLFGIGGGFIWSCVASAFPRRVNRIVTVGILAAFGLLFIVQCLIRSSFQLYMPLHSVLNGAGKVTRQYGGNLLLAILHGIPVILLFLAPAALYYFWGERYLPARRMKPRGLAKTLLYGAAIFGLGVLLASTGKSRRQYVTEYQFDSATRYFGLLTSIRLDGKYALLGNKEAAAFQAVQGEKNEETSVPKSVRNTNEMDLELDEPVSDPEIQAMNEYVSSLTPSNKNPYTGIFKGKNLILICAEAFSDVAINEELTPTLYRMAHSGFYFSDFYQPLWGGSTSTGEYSFLTGLVPLHQENTILEARDNNLYFTMGNALQREGYFSRCYHNGTYDYYSRDLTHTNLGYEQYLGLGNGLEKLCSHSWPEDTEMFEVTMDTYLDKQPFSIYYMTISGHCSYTADRVLSQQYIDQVRGVYGDRYADTTLYYLCYQMELENALKRMIEKLEEAGIADDTVICMTSDHYPYGLENSATFGNTEDYVIDLYGHEHNTPWGRDHNALFIWSGCLEKEYKNLRCDINTPTYTLDILPTLLNLFGVEYDSRLLVGRDVFSNEEPLVLWNNYSWLTTKGRYNSATEVFTPNEGVEVEDGYVERMQAIVSNKISFSDNVLETDYYEVLLKGKTGKEK